MSIHGSLIFSTLILAYILAYAACKYYSYSLSSYIQTTILPVGSIHVRKLCNLWGRHDTSFALTPLPDFYWLSTLPNQLLSICVANIPKHKQSNFNCKNFLWSWDHTFVQMDELMNKMVLKNESLY